MITGFSDLIKSSDGLSEEDTKKFATEISSSATRMLDIIIKLLDVRSIEDGEMKLDFKRCSVRSCVDRAKRDFEAIAKRKGIELLVTHQDPADAVSGDEGAIAQILDNLVSNAIKYSPPGRVVEIFTGGKDEVVAVDVVDEGPGLSKEDQEKLFQKFGRLTPQPTGGETSNGLGLWTDWQNQ